MQKTSDSFVDDFVLRSLFNFAHPVQGNSHLFIEPKGGTFGSILSLFFFDLHSLNLSLSQNGVNTKKRYHFESLPFFSANLTHLSKAHSIASAPNTERPPPAASGDQIA